MAKKDNIPKVWEFLGVSKPTWYRWSLTERETELKARESQENSLTEKEALAFYRKELEKSHLGAGEFLWERERLDLEEEVKAYLENLTPEQKKSLELFKGIKTLVSFGNDPRFRLRLAHIPALEKIIPIPRGRMIEIFGDKGTGKTTLSILIAKEFKKNSPLRIMFIDTEKTLSEEYLVKNGLTDVELVSEDNAKEALDTFIRAASSKRYSLIVLDSIASLKVAAEEKNELGDANMGVRAFLMNQFIRRLTQYQNKETTFVFTNQIRDSLKSYGSDFTTPGGHAIKHGATLRLWLKRGKIMVEKTKFGGIPNGTEFKYEW